MSAPSPHSQLASFSASTDVIVPENGEAVGTREVKCCIRQIQELIVSRLNQAVANKLISSVDYLRESFVGTLERCLQSLEKSQDVSVHITSNYLKQVLKDLLDTTSQTPQETEPTREPNPELAKNFPFTVLPIQFEFCFVFPSHDPCLSEVLVNHKVAVKATCKTVKTEVKGPRETKSMINPCRLCLFTEGYIWEP